jgi:hypothetical protein
MKPSNLANSRACLQHCRKREKVLANIEFYLLPYEDFKTLGTLKELSMFYLFPCARLFSPGQIGIAYYCYDVPFKSIHKYIQRLTNARSCRVGDMTVPEGGFATEWTPTEPSKRQFAEGRGRLCARCLLCLLVDVNRPHFWFLPSPSIVFFLQRPSSY